MIVFKKTYQNGHERDIQVVSAKYTDNRNLSIFLFPPVGGPLVISEKDHPDLMEQLMLSGLEISPGDAPPACPENPQLEVMP